MAQYQSIKNIYLNSIENPAYIVDTSGVLLEWNSRFCESFGLNDSDLIDKQLDQILPESIHQNNIDVIAKKLSEFKILEIFETQHTSPELFYSHKQLVTDENGEIIGLLNVSSADLLKKPRDVLSWQTKHQLRELLNAMAGALENHKSDSGVATKSLKKELNIIFNRLSVIISNIGTENTSTFDVNPEQQQWPKILWISDDINKDLQIDVPWKVNKISAFSAIEAAKSKKISRGVYQIVLIDAPLLQYLYHYVDFLDDTSLNICVGQAHMGKHQIQHFFKVTKEKLLETWEKILPRLWQNFIQHRTVDRVANSGVLNILSVEDNQTSRDALEELLAQYSFIVTTHCSTVLEAKNTVMSRPFDLIILDLGLVGMKSDYSYELAQSIRKIQQQKGDFFCPVIVNTGHELAGEKDLLFKYGVNEFYRKPELLRSLGYMLAKYFPEKLNSQ